MQLYGVVDAVIHFKWWILAIKGYQITINGLWYGPNLSHPPEGPPPLLAYIYMYKYTEGENERVNHFRQNTEDIHIVIHIYTEKHPTYKVHTGHVHT